MSDCHEIALVELLGGRRTKNSGAVFNDPMDGRNTEGPHPLAWDGKSTFGKSVGVSREMWAKALQQAHHETPLLALRWYEDDYSLTPVLDLAALDLNDFATILEDARRWRQASENGCLEGHHRWVASSDCSVCGVSSYNVYDEE
jgi:hypothetical protein